jgi:hypothetical protein
MFSYKDSNHQAVGPVSADEIRRLAAAGLLTRNSLLSAEKSDFWQPAYRFSELADVFGESGSKAPPAPGPVQEPTPPPDSPDESIDVEAQVEVEREPGPPPLDDTSADTEPAPEEKGESKQPVYYRFIGGDGREYGPVTADQLRDWIGQRRADQNSRVRCDGSDRWSTLSELPEFRDAFNEQSRRQQASPPPLDSGRADQIAEEIIGDGYDLNIADCFRRSWRLYLDNFGILTGTTALVIVILSVLNSIVGAGNVAGFALGGVFLAGLSLVFLKQIRGQAATVQDTFEGFKRGFIPLLIASILTSIFIIIGLGLCFLPGIYLMVAWMFVFPLAFELRLDFWPAMELSRKVVHERWWEMFGLAVGVGLLLFVGILLFGLGVFFTAPIALGAVMYAYEDIFRKYSVAAPGAAANEPPATGENSGSHSTSGSN